MSVFTPIKEVDPATFIYLITRAYVMQNPKYNTEMAWLKHRPFCIFYKRPRPIPLY